MMKFLILPALFFSFASHAQLTLTQLRDKGAEAYSNDNCIGAVKYLYAYQIMSKNLSEREFSSLDKAINYCEKKLTEYVITKSFQSGLTVNRGVVMNSSGELQTFDFSNTGVLITAEGGLKVLNPDNGGVFVNSSGVMETINNTTGGVLISPDGTVSETPKDIEYLIRGVNSGPKDGDNLGFIVEKKKIELENLERYQELMKIRQNDFDELKK